jgi:predicted DNA-binding transcriptional regulator AlpA
MPSIPASRRGRFALRGELAVLGVSQSLGYKLARRDRFPAPVDSTATGRPLWRVQDVERWNRRRLRGR